MSRRGAWVVVAVLVLAVLLSAGPGPGLASERARALRLTGTVVRVAAIGGETTGWALDMDPPATVDGRTLKRVELAPAARVERFADLRVEVTGHLTWRRGIERADYAVLDVDAVRALPPQ